MKKILPVLIIGLMFAFNVKAADDVKSFVLYENGNKVISASLVYQEDRSSGYKYDAKGYKFFVNSRQIGDSPYESGSLFRFYGTDKSDVKVVYSEYYYARTWNFIDLSGSRHVKLQENPNNTLNLNGKSVVPKVDARGCNSKNVKNESMAKNVKSYPVLDGFANTYSEKKLIYKASKNSQLACVFIPSDGGSIPVADEPIMKILGIDYGLNFVYFSADGKGWTAYYAYDLKANKVTKTTLAKINKNKLKLSLLFDFDAKAAEEANTTVLYRFGENVITMKNDQSLQAFGQADGMGCLGFRFYLDGKDILVNENESLGYGHVGGGVCEINDSAIYKTNFKDYFVLKNKSSVAEEVDSVYWYFVNSRNLNVLTAFECSGGDCVAFGKSGIQAVINDKNEFIGFKIADKFVYQPLKPAEVAKLKRCSEATPECGYFPVLVQRVLGLSSDLKTFYFSAAGKDWTAYYSYDIKDNKIAETTLDKINKDKIELTLVKKF